ncbi:MULTISPECIES: DNA-binding transcriptional regulator Fis [unclassified Halomonas]|uniref:DNA-binding transcriptional regulator Fis n=1 Tax=unclassified Halomonas TaxID=2609666 RepID=UPI0006DA5ABD|nr:MULTISPECIES: DNA-binding transcriptional regulator Fis [unclassified Halomonas]KPQ26995.1 MAG: transcriptional activator Fis [Halomonas sp. HL-93]SBR49070.1 Fis family transcriptional regulator, factor for inversion stimulation protein [Halomonas sp. HL-93]SNY95967.1 Fis family transcriptional regulator, factor for inversion stimulation protein [Halomonas sp. hl-4]
MTERDLDLLSSDSAPDSHARLNGTLADPAASTPPQPLREAVETAMRRYFEHLDGSQATDLYAMVMAEVEAPLLTCVLEHTDGNQTRAADVLGLNRGTLRKKLKLYGLIEGDAP